MAKRYFAQQQRKLSEYLRVVENGEKPETAMRVYLDAFVTHDTQLAHNATCLEGRGISVLGL